MKLVAEKLGKNYTVTLGNLTSFILLKFGKETKIKKHQFIELILKLKKQIESTFPEITIASELKKETIQIQLESIFSKLKTVKLIDWEEETIHTKEILYHIPKSIHNLKKSNIVMYHRNQLTAHLQHLEDVWNGIFFNQGATNETT